ncbi:MULTISPECIES: DJ-1/PfpI family protein [unclassified Streptomyces]|uniref:DJ-1/PfpI family protein n=1 Tax=Streptomyces evansiae TaxID=3075535 RepID=A0ABU2QVN0_9ACTN|nr:MULTISPECIES: DJ-1/PfpI family protein [unclassified Streptomyces]MYQ58755.1 DJ-1/PfpI family protein [Streptomyces sp. SID4926]MYR25769.1 DJ-1/PfpI family protein [Streptomyces sp. SID4945]EFL03648.1 4-methyl-5(B-hydroxyethyl)-thiazole monophosphate biosynthesis enzyme [Streptomyces sp. SPB78]MDT0408507.1 DJ-1/PfpI family protein [Streptomyces sp. DSM 41979]NJA59582.1 DJ-1/PfpI family protein [Streptomyces sp. NEAU-H3]
MPLIALALFDGFTALDAIGPYEMLCRVPGARTVFVADRPRPVLADRGEVTLGATHAYEDVAAPDLLLVPGGPGQSAHMTDPALLGWLRAADARTRWTTSVCTGALLLAAAGLLTGRRATTHWLFPDVLREYGAEPVAERVVRDGKYVTAAGVSAGIDMGLALVGELAGRARAEEVQLATEYDPEPPYDAGSPAKAPAALVARLRAGRRPVVDDGTYSPVRAARPGAVSEGRRDE